MRSFNNLIRDVRKETMEKMNVGNAQIKQTANPPKMMKNLEYYFINDKKKSGETSKTQVKTVKLTERIQIKTSKALHYLFRCSENLYNQANTLLIKGTHVFVLTKGRSTQKAGKLIPYRALERELKDEPEYRALPAQTSQQILLLLQRNWKSFFEAYTNWKKHPEKYEKRPQSPKLRKNGESILIFTNQQIRIKGKMLYFPKRTQLLPIRVNEARLGKLKQVRVLPRGYYSILEIIYEREVVIPSLANEQKNRILALDLGVRNTICAVNNCGLRPFIVKGGAIKWINQYYNKIRARYQKIYANYGIKSKTKRLQQLARKRNNKIEDLFHKLSKVIIQYCMCNQINTVVIGYNELWKQRLNLGKRNNQNFVGIPFYRLIEKIKYKAELKGINVVLIGENHTSKCSFLDNESIEHHNTYKGKRGIYRPKDRGGNGKIEFGLFKTAQGKIINSDVNGAYNILRKAFPKAISADEIEGLGLVPYSVSFAELEHLANLKSAQKVILKASEADGIEVRGIVPSSQGLL